LDEKSRIHTDDLQVYCDLSVLHEDMTERFKDLLSMEIPDWVINPFSYIGKVRVLEEELMGLQNDFQLKPKFKKPYQEFWLHKEIPGRYPAAWREIKKLLISFPTSYLVEHDFSVVVRLLSKQRNRLQITHRGDLRLLLTEIKPDIGKLTSLHQVHPSH
jgi:hypothetical protein